MGDNALTSRTDGERIPAADHNELVQALLGDVVPRNNSRVVEDIIGSLGRSDLRWLRAYVKEHFIGTSANNLKIYEGAVGELWIELGGTSGVQLRLSSNGMSLYKDSILVIDMPIDGTLDFISPDKYINHDSLKTNGSRVAVGTYNKPNATGNVNDIIYQTNINGLKAGKTVVWTDTHLCTADFGGDEGDVEFFINGVEVFAYTNFNYVGPLSTAIKYTIPSDGNYNFRMEARDTEGHERGAYKIEVI